MPHKGLKLTGVLVIALITVFNYFTPLYNASHTPQTVWYSDKAELASIRGGLNGLILRTDETMLVSVTGDERLNEDISVSLFGIIPLREITAVKREKIILVPSGKSVGITIQTRGLLVVDTSDVCIDSNGTTVKSPAYKAGLRSGDVILSVNGTETDTTSALTDELTDKMHIHYMRGKKEIETDVFPVLDRRTNQLRLGAWVREDTAGIGTLSFYDPVTGNFAALGHAVTDVDTGTACEIKYGTLSECSIVSVEHGKSGSPGELIGIFSSSEGRMGKLIANTEFGIFGEGLSTEKTGVGYRDGVQLAYPDEVHTGEAKMLCTTDSGEPKEYSCRIIKCSAQNEPSVKGIVVEVTDERLIEKTGGIVQGMSGSPIIQDGKLVGVVTHVMINNPKRGYGVYAYWMYTKGQGTRG